MPIVFGEDVGVAPNVPRARVATPKASTATVTGKTRVVYAFDTTRFTDPVDGLRLVIDVSPDGGVTWRELAACTLPGGATAAKTGETPRGIVNLPKEATHVRYTLIALIGAPIVGMWTKGV